MQKRDRVCPTRSITGSPLASRKTSSQRSGDLVVAKVDRRVERMIESFMPDASTCVLCGWAATGPFVAEYVT